MTQEIFELIIELLAKRVKELEGQYTELCKVLSEKNAYIWKLENDNKILKEPVRLEEMANYPALNQQQDKINEDKNCVGEPNTVPQSKHEMAEYLLNDAISECVILADNHGILWFNQQPLGNREATIGLLLNPLRGLRKSVEEALSKVRAKEPDYETRVISAANDVEQATVKEN